MFVCVGGIAKVDAPPPMAFGLLGKRKRKDNETDRDKWTNKETEKLGKITKIRKWGKFFT